jgi:thiamine-monophosphate kinase
MEAARRAAAAWLRPSPRLVFAAALAEAGLARAAVDISDGLLQDLGHVARESGVTIRVDAAAVPVHRLARAADSAPTARSVDAAGATPRAARAARAARAGRTAQARAGAALPQSLQLALAGGEDYEVAFTASPRRRAAILELARRERTPVHVIGVVEAGRAVVTDAAGRAFALHAAGFDHGLAARRR